MSGQSTTDEKIGESAASQNARAQRKPLSPIQKASTIAVVALAMVALCIATGFLIFSTSVLLATTKMPQKADAIVVVTGGSGRLEQASKLLTQGYGKRLLVSGVHPTYRASNLRRTHKFSQDQIDCCIDLDHIALNTVGNATKTAEWARKHTFKTIILVTSAYHMPRTLLEMQRAAPEMKFQAHIVTPTQTLPWMQRLFNGSNLKLLAKEYGKLLLSLFHATSERLAKNASIEPASNSSTLKGNS